MLVAGRPAAAEPNATARAGAYTAEPDTEREGHSTKRSSFHKAGLKT